MMTAILFLILIVTLVVLTKGSANLMGKILGKMVSERHRIAELIVNEGKVPKPWTQPLEKRTNARSRSLLYDEQRQVLESKAKQDLLKKLDRLIDFFRKSSLFTDPETKQLLLSKLLEARESWPEMDWKDLLSLSSDLD